MRTNIDINDELLAKAMQAGPCKTKKEAVEAGLQLLARQAAYREILKWEGKLKWEGDESIDWTQLPASQPLTVQAPANRYGRKPVGKSGKPRRKLAESVRPCPGPVGAIGCTLAPQPAHDAMT